MNLAFVLAAAVCIGQVETITRQHDTFLGAMSRAWPLIIVGQFCLYNIFNKETGELILANTTIHHALRTLRFTKASSSSNLRNTARYERYSCEGYYARFAD